MALLKASEADFDLPLVGWFGDGPRIFSDREELLECPSTFYEDGDLIGVELIDNRLRRWVIRSVELCSPLPKRRWWERRFIFHLLFPIVFWLIIASNNNVEIDPQLEEIAPADLDEVKARVVRYLEHISGEYRPLDSPEDQTDLARVDEARDIGALINILEESASPGFLD
jgi:hypothetical protein